MPVDLDDPSIDYAYHARELRQLTSLSRQFGSSISDAFARGASTGKGFDGILRSLGERLSQIALRAAFKPVETAISQAFGALSGALGSGGSLFASASGNAIAGGRVLPFASGGVIAAPTYFPLGRDTGLAGEAGPEAILPLARGADGRLGVRSAGGGRAPMSIVVNVSTPDAESFRRSETQVAAALARAVARGQRGL